MPAKICYHITMNREKSIVRTSIVGIFANIVLVGFKLLVGVMAGSIAIIVDAVNNLTDVLSSVVTIIGTKLAARRPDEEHPYGHGRYEHLTTLIIGMIILATGIMALLESVPKIIHPELADYSWATITVVVAAIMIKLALGTYVRRAGKKYSSNSLIASGIDALFDAALSLATLVGIAITLISQISVDGILGAIISLFIMRTSIEILAEASNEILGHTASPELMRSLKELICTFPEVSGAYDLMLHSYGPTEMIGSVQIQVPDHLTAKEIHHLTREIAERVYSKYNIRLTIGIYAENADSTTYRDMRGKILDIVNLYPEIHQVHAFYIDDDTRIISFDIVIPINYAQKSKLKAKLSRTLHKTFPEYKALITIDFDLENPK